jgi:hypothetical protein
MNDVFNDGDTTPFCRTVVRALLPPTSRAVAILAARGS